MSYYHHLIQFPYFRKKYVECWTECSVFFYKTIFSFMSELFVHKLIYLDNLCMLVVIWFLVKSKKQLSITTFAWNQELICAWIGELQLKQQKACKKLRWPIFAFPMKLMLPPVLVLTYFFEWLIFRLFNNSKWCWLYFLWDYTGYVVVGYYLFMWP